MTQEHRFKGLQTYAGGAIKACRVSHNMTQQQLAIVISSAESWYYPTESEIDKIEKGRKKVSFAQFCLIAEAFKFPIEKILDLMQSTRDFDQKEIQEQLADKARQASNNIEDAQKVNPESLKEAITI